MCGFGFPLFSFPVQATQRFPLVEHKNPAAFFLAEAVSKQESFDW